MVAEAGVRFYADLKGSFLGKFWGKYDITTYDALVLHVCISARTMFISNLGNDISMGKKTEVERVQVKTNRCLVKTKHVRSWGVAY